MENIVFFVVLASSVIQGPTIGLLAKQLGLDRKTPPKPAPANAPTIKPEGPPV